MSAMKRGFVWNLTTRKMRRFDVNTLGWVKSYVAYGTQAYKGDVSGDNKMLT